MVRLRWWIAGVAWVLGAATAGAQNWSFDARDVGMGVVSGAGNVASQMIDADRGYRTIVLPFGLIQIAGDRNRLDPARAEFDIVRAFEYAAGPLHYTFRRESSTAARTLWSDVRAAAVSRDLNQYRGLVIADQPHAGGVASPDWGVTYRFSRGPGAAYRGLYLGIGPYLSLQSAFDVDPQLKAILASTAAVYRPSTQMRSQVTTQMQTAVAGVIGYRARMALDRGVSDRDGIYIAANYRYLHGMRYEDDRLALTLDTDAAGLLTLTPRTPAPVRADRWYSTSGHGHAFDLGVGAVLGGWSADVGASGLGNRLDWRDLQNTTYSLANLFHGDAAFRSTPTGVASSFRVTLPVEYRGRVVYTGASWSVGVSAGTGLGGPSFRVGGERRLAGLDVRAGAVRAREMWNPTVGIGVPLAGRLALDVAGYANTANIERERRPAVAVSLRIAF